MIYIITDETLCYLPIRKRFHVEEDQLAEG